MKIIAETPRLTIRHFVSADLDALAPILADPEVMRFSAVGVRSQNETQKLLHEICENYQKYNFGLYAVIHKKDQQLIGFCGLSHYTVDNQPEIEIGYRLAVAYWGQGLGTEAAMAVRNYSITELKISRLIAIVEAANTRSIRVVEKIGMIHEKDTLYKNIPVRIYSLLSQNLKQ